MRVLRAGLAGSLMLLALVMTSPAKASPALGVIYTLSTNNLGLSGPIGVITVTDVSGGVQVKIAMDSGFSLKLDGGDIAFNLSTASTAGAITFDSISFGGTTITSPNISIGKSGAKNNLSIFGSFGDDLQNLKCAKSSCGNGVVSADDLVFTIDGLTTADFGSGSSFALHFCTASGSNCGPSTGFTGGTGSPSGSTPEPASLLLLGTGLLGMGALIRRKISA